MSKVLARPRCLRNLSGVWRIFTLLMNCLNRTLRRPKTASPVGNLGEPLLQGELLHALRRRDELAMLIDRIFAYAYMRRDEDNSNKIPSLLTRPEPDGHGQQCFRFLEPEILSLTVPWCGNGLRLSPSLKPTAISPQHPSPKSPYPLCGTGRALAGAGS